MPVLFLNPGRPILDFLVDLHKTVQSAGLAPTLDALTAQLNRQAVVDSWLKTSTWPEAIAYLRNHSEVLQTQEVVEQLAQSEQPEKKAHAAILQLVERLSLQKIERILTSTESAIDEAQNALERADLVEVYCVTVANPKTLEVPVSATCSLRHC